MNNTQTQQDPQDKDSIHSPQTQGGNSGYVNEFAEKDESEQVDVINYDQLLTAQPRERDLSEDEETLANNVVFYCKECNALIPGERKKSKKLQFVCPTCEGSVYIGSELGIRNFFHLRT